MVTAVGMLTVRGQADDWTLDNTERAVAHSCGAQPGHVSVSDTEARLVSIDTCIIHIGIKYLVDIVNN